VSASVIAFSRVAPEREGDFLAWESEIEAVERTFEGFVGHRIERPASEDSDEWTVIIAFDTDEHLETWLGSPQRRVLLARAAEFNANLRLERTSYGFGFWGQDSGGPKPSPHRIFKENLLVLLVLYPVVFLWGFFIGDPLLGGTLGWPFWLALFIGNLVSTQLLGWWLVPMAMKAFRRWLQPRPGWVTQFVGYGIVVILCCAFMALYAVLLSLPR